MIITTIHGEYPIRCLKLDRYLEDARDRELRRRKKEINEYCDAVGVIIAMAQKLGVPISDVVPK